MNFEEQLKKALKEMFLSGDIEIRTDIGEDYGGKYIETVVDIGDVQVYRNEERLYLRFT